MALIGAILGDIAGSQYEYDRPRNLDWKNCELFSDHCEYTDDTIMSLAVKFAADHDGNYEAAMKVIGRQFPTCGYGPAFWNWIFTDGSQAYNSFGNGAAMRVSYLADKFDKLEDVQKAARESAIVSHNHIEGIKGAVVTATCIWMAKHGKTKEEIYNYVLAEYPEDDYRFPISRTMKDLRENYSWDVTCQTSVPVAMRCFYESTDYESFIRNVLSMPCDTDTLCAIGGGVAEEFYHGTGMDNDALIHRYMTNELLLSILNS